MFRSINFGKNFAGLTTVGYRLLSKNNEVIQPRTTENVLELDGPSGVYGADINPPADFTGIILWDTAIGSPNIGAEDWVKNDSGIVNVVDLRGTGAQICTITILNNFAQPVADADVWITADPAGITVVAGTLQTNSAGQIPFLLNAGVTYYLWVQKDGVNSLQGHPFVAEAD